MINNARELVIAEGFVTLQNLGRKYNNHSPFTVWVGLRPPNKALHRPVWHDETEAQREETLDLEWESVELVGFNDKKDVETEPIVLIFPFVYNSFLDAINDVITMASKL